MALNDNEAVFCVLVFVCAARFTCKCMAPSLCACVLLPAVCVSVFNVCDSRSEAVKHQ